MNWDKIYRETSLKDLPWYPGDEDDMLRDAVYSGWLRGQIALDIGAGQGTDAIYLATNGYQMTCLDVSEEARNIALQEAEKSHVELTYEIGNALAMPFEENSFDVALDRGCFHHIALADRETYVQELSRVLKQGSVYFYRNFTETAMATMLPDVAPEHRLSEAAIRALFEPRFNIIEFGTHLAKGRAGRDEVEMYYAVMQA